MPEISVVMPFYNPGEIVRKTISSVLAQSFTDFEFIIVNDGSDAKNRAILAEFADPRLIVVDQDNRGMASARNAGIARAGGKYIALLDHDDIFLPDKLTRQRENLEAHPECVLNYTRCRREGPTTRTFPDYPLYEGQVLTPLLKQNFITSCSCVMIRRSALTENDLGFRAEFAPADDWKLYLDLALVGEFSALPEELAVYTLHDRNFSNDLPRMYRAGYNLLRHSLAKLPAWSAATGIPRRRLKRSAFAGLARNAYGLAYCCRRQKATRQFRYWNCRALHFDPLLPGAWKLYFRNPR